VENLRSRINAALGLTAQGFKDRCEIPAGAGSVPLGIDSVSTAPASTRAVGQAVGGSA